MDDKPPRTTHEIELVASPDGTGMARLIKVPFAGKYLVELPDPDRGAWTVWETIDPKENRGWLNSFSIGQLGVHTEPEHDKIVFTKFGGDRHYTPKDAWQAYQDSVAKTFTVKQPEGTQGGGFLLLTLGQITPYVRGTMLIRMTLQP